MTRLLSALLCFAAAGLLACGDRPSPAPPAPPSLAADPAAPPAAQGIPVRVRIIRGARKGTAQVDPRLADLKKQLGKLAYVKWDQVQEVQLTIADRKTQFVELPDGQHVGFSVLEVHGETVTFEVALAQRNTMSRLTIEKGQRIVHQVSGEKGGVAYFVTLRAWP
jgi:hypothetical protein